MSDVPRILIVDHDPEARYRTRQLAEAAGFMAGGEAGIGTEAVSRAVESQPDVVLFGLSEPLVRALQTMEAIVHDLPETPVIAYAESGDLQIVRQAMLAGARDFLPQPLSAAELQHSWTATLDSKERRRRRGNGAAALGPRGAIVTVFGAKGGAGKTTVATNLAVAIAMRRDRNVALVDADDSFGDAAANLGLAEGPSLTEALRGSGALDAATLQRYITYHDSGVAVMESPPSPFEWRGVTGERLRGALVELARQYDVVLVDTASTLSDVSLAALQAASLVLWVTTPDYASAHDSVRALRVLSSVPVEDERVRLVMNVNTPEIDVAMESVETALGRSIFWSVPYDRQVRRAAQLGQTVAEVDNGSPAARSFDDLATVLSGGSPAVRKDGLFTKLLGNGHGAALSHQGART